MSNKMLTLMMGFVAFLILAIGVVFVFALAGGGDDDNTAPADGGNKSTPKAGASSGKICEGNILYVAGGEPNSLLDPIQVGDVETSEYIVEIFGGLVTLDTNLKVQPDVAKSWEVSNGGKSYT
ncbi:MAG: hypothetical protein ABI939_07555, partial [Anaerolineaceae bacterium]